MQENFDNLINWLLFSSLDFDFISESMIPQLYSGSEDKYTKLGQMEYEVIIVPELTTIRSSTVKMLYEHVEKGGKVIFLGHLPQIIDGDFKQKFDTEGFKEFVINNTKHDIADALEDYRQVDILNEDNTRNENFLYQLRGRVGL